MSAKTTGPSGDLSDVFAAEAPRCGFGGLFDESLLARRFDRLFTHHRARLEASIAGIDRAREAVKPLGVALTFAASGYPVNDGYPPRGPGRRRDLRQELVGSQHGGHRGKEEVPGSDRALASGTPHGEPGAERHHHRRQLGGGIGVRENAAEACRARIRGWPTKGMAWAINGQRSRISGERSSAGWRTRAPIWNSSPGPGFMVASAANAVDVDYLARPREAEVEHGHETLAAGQGPGLVAVAGQEAQRLRDRQRIVIADRGGFIAASLGRGTCQERWRHCGMTFWAMSTISAVMRANSPEFNASTMCSTPARW